MTPGLPMLASNCRSSHLIDERPGAFTSKRCVGFRPWPLSPIKLDPKASSSVRAAFIFRIISKPSVCFADVTPMAATVFR